MYECKTCYFLPILKIPGEAFAVWLNQEPGEIIRVSRFNTGFIPILLYGSQHLVRAKYFFHVYVPEIEQNKVTLPNHHATPLYLVTFNLKEKFNLKLIY